MKLVTVRESGSFVAHGAPRRVAEDCATPSGGGGVERAARWRGSLERKLVLRSASSVGVTRSSPPGTATETPSSGSEKLPRPCISSTAT